MKDHPSFVIISPVRNEEKYIERTIFSVTSQTIKPLFWLIVDDGSRDKTADIVKSYSKLHKWIKLIRKKDRGHTEVGRGVIEAFNMGLQMLQDIKWEYIVKLDCDLYLEEDYFEKLSNKFFTNQKLGIAGGTSFMQYKNGFYEEKMPFFHPWAGARMYRRKCFGAICGLKETLGWDTIDLVRAQMKNWQTQRFEDLKIVHYRRMSSRKGLWEGKLRTGKNFYITGYSPVFLIARSIYRLTQRPFLIESLGVVYGYFKAMLKKEPLVVTEDEKKFLRKQQQKRLLGLEIR